VRGAYNRKREGGKESTEGGGVEYIGAGRVQTLRRETEGDGMRKQRQIKFQERKSNWQRDRERRSEMK
jgi:hypothetical protein